MGTARSIACLAALAITLAIAVPASAQPRYGPRTSGRTGSQALHLPSSYRNPRDPGDPAGSYRWGPAHRSLPAPAALRDAGGRLPRTIYYIHGLGTQPTVGRDGKKVGGVRAWKVEGAVRRDVSIEMQARSDGDRRRAFYPWEQAFDVVTGLQWNWVGSSRSGGVTIRPGGIGDVTVPPVNDFDRVARNHDIQCWIDANFAPGTVVVLDLGGGRWQPFWPMGDMWRLRVRDPEGREERLVGIPVSHVAVATSFSSCAWTTVSRAQRVARRCPKLAARVTDLRLRHFLVSPNPGLIQELFKDTEFRRYMTDEFTATAEDMARRVEADAKLRGALARELKLPAGASAVDVMRAFLDPGTSAIWRGLAWERYLVKRERAVDLNEVKRNFTLVDMAMPGDGKLVSVAFGRPGRYVEKFDHSRDSGKLGKCLADMRRHAARLTELGVRVPANEAELLKRLEICTGTEAEAEELRGYIRRRLQRFSVRENFTADVYGWMQRAFGSDEAIRDHLIHHLVRGPR